MGNVNFYLKAAATGSGKSLIYLKYKYQGQVLVYTFGQSINENNWNFAKQRAKSNKATTPDGKHSVNDLLNNLQEVLLTAHTKEIGRGIPKPGTLKRYLDEFILQNISGEKKEGPTFFQLAERFIKGEIKNRGKEKSKSSLKNYHAVTKHLKEFQLAKKYPVTFDSINLNFFYQYTSFLSDEISVKGKEAFGLAPNTIAKDISILKVIMGEAVDLGYKPNMDFRMSKFSFSEVETDNVYLTEKEVIDLYKFDLSHRKKLEQVRDLFVFGAWVGLRFSDFSNVKPENIVKIEGDYFIKMVTMKTKELVIIPCNPIVLEIFEKYQHNPNKLPPTISNQKFNDYIKDACKEAEITEKGRLSTAPETELWQCVSSHTARRSFATNYYLQGFPTIDLMKITGHKTEKAFLKYIRVSKLDTAKRLNAHIKKSWSEKMLKVA